MPTRLVLTKSEEQIVRRAAGEPTLAAMEAESAIASGSPRCELPPLNAPRSGPSLPTIGPGDDPLAVAAARDRGFDHQVPLPAGPVAPASAIGGEPAAKLG
jgi:hypothetical protein